MTVGDSQPDEKLIEALNAMSLSSRPDKAKAIPTIGSKNQPADGFGTILPCHFIEIDKGDSRLEECGILDRLDLANLDIRSKKLADEEDSPEVDETDLIAVKFYKRLLLAPSQIGRYEVTILLEISHLTVDRG